MGVISITQGVFAAAALHRVYKAPDRTLALMASMVLAGWAISMIAHSVFPMDERSLPLTWLDAISLDIAALGALCRFDRPYWLYGLVLNFAVECACHIGYCCIHLDWLYLGHNYLACLNVCFGIQIILLLIAPLHGDKVIVPTVRRRLTTHL